jgi:NTE family protein
MKNYIKRLRLEHGGMSPQELANIIGCRPQTIISIEKGEYIPSVEMALKISRVFKVALEEVFQYEEQKINTGQVAGKRKIGLALGGGAARGLAHIGVLAVLEKEGIDIDMIAGTSMGSLIGAIYARQRNAAKLEALAEHWGTKRLFLFSDLTLSRAGLIRGRKIDKMLMEILGDVEFKDLHIPFACVATDIDSGEEVVIRQGLVWKGIRASISIPIVLKAVRDEGRYLVDGGLLDQVPVDVLQEMGADFIIAVNVTSNAQLLNHEVGTDERNGRTKQPSILQVVMRTMQIVNRRGLNYELTGADIIIEPELEQIGWGDFHRVSECVLQGELAAAAAIPEIKRKLGLSKNDCLVQA